MANVDKVCIILDNTDYEPSFSCLGDLPATLHYLGVRKSQYMLNSYKQNGNRLVGVFFTPHTQHWFNLHYYIIYLNAIMKTLMQTKIYFTLSGLLTTFN